MNVSFNGIGELSVTFMAEEGTTQEMSPSKRGTATHQFLQFADFDTLRQYGSAACAAYLLDKKFLSQADIDAVYMEQLEAFRHSDLLGRICASGEVWREFRFNVPMDASRFTADPDLLQKLDTDGIRLIVQGVVDCVFRDTDGTLTLVDYKTDKPLPEEYKNPALADARFRKRHTTQLSYYREICQSLFQEPIARTVIYSTALAREIPVPTDAQV